MIPVVSLNSFKPAFCDAKNGDNKNPISKGGERALALKATVVAGIGVGFEALWYLFDDGFMFEDIFDKSQKVAQKSKKNNPLKGVGAFVALTAGFVAAVAAVYTLYKSPNIEYKAKVNSFVKGKDMDVYIKGNEVETELYNQMNEKTKDATEEEKVKLREQYLKLKAAKNQLPDWALQK